MVATAARISLRRMAVRLLLVCACLVGTVAFVPATACACSCVARPPAAIVKDSSAIVVGTPVAKDVDGSAVRYRVEVANSYKQRVPETITVLTTASSAACGMDLELDRERLVVLGHTPDGLAAADGEWGASLCDNTAVTTAQLADFLGPSIKPFAADDTREPQPAVVGVFVAIAALVALPGGLLWWRMRRRTSRPDSNGE